MPPHLLWRVEKMTKYSLRWWYETGAIFRAQGSRNKRVAKGLIAHIAFLLGYYFGEWKLAPEGDSVRIMNLK
jgi:hypothetical protein